MSEAQAWGYAFGMVFLTVVYGLFSTYGEYLGQVVAMRMRTSCTAMLARKVQIFHYSDTITCEYKVFPIWEMYIHYIIFFSILYFR